MKISTIIISLCFIATLCCNAQSDESNRLFAQGVELYEAGEYAEAIKIFEKVDRIDAIELDSTSNRRLYAGMWKASCLYKMGRTEEASGMCPFLYSKTPIDRRLTIIADSLTTEAEQESAKDNDLQAMLLTRQCLEEKRRVLGDKHYYLVPTLIDLGCYNLTQKMSLLSISNFEEAIKIIDEEVPGWDIKLQCLQLLGSAYITVDLGKTVDIWEIYTDLEAKTNGVESESWKQIKEYEMQICISQSDWKRLETVEKSTLKSYESYYGKNDDRVLNMINGFAELHDKQGQTDVAQSYRNMLIDRMQPDSPTNQAYSYMLKMQQAMDQMQQGNRKKGLSILRQIAKETNESNDSLLCQVNIYATILMLTDAIEQQDFSKSKELIPVYQKAKEINANKDALGLLACMILLSKSLQDEEITETDRELIPEFEDFVLNQNSALLYLGLGAIQYRLGEFKQFRATVNNGMNLIRQALTGQLDISPVQTEKELDYALQIFEDQSYRIGENDSTRYTFAKVRADLEELKIELMLNRKSEDILNDGLRRRLSEYNNLVFYVCADTIKGRTFLKHKIDWVADNYDKESAVYEAMIEAYVHAFEDKDPEGEAIYKALMALQEKRSSPWLPYTRKAYYLYMGDYDALVELQLSTDISDGVDGELMKADIYYLNNFPEKAFVPYQSIINAYPSAEGIDMAHVAERYILSAITAGYILKLDSLLDNIDSAIERCVIAQKPQAAIPLMIGLARCSSFLGLAPGNREKLSNFIDTKLDLLDIEDKVAIKSHLTFYTSQSDSGDDLLQRADKALKAALSDPQSSAEFTYAKAVIMCRHSGDGRISSEDKLKTLDESIAYFEKLYGAKLPLEYYTLLIERIQLLYELARYNEAVKDFENWRQGQSANEKFKIFRTAAEMFPDFIESIFLDRYIEKAISYSDMGHSLLAKVVDAKVKSDSDANIEEYLEQYFAKAVESAQNDLISGKWDQASKSSNTLQEQITRYSSIYPKGDISKLAYNATILNKGMLLSAEGGLYALMAESDNLTLKQYYHDLLRTRLLLDKAADHHQPTDSLQQRAAQLMGALIKHSGTMGDFTSVLNATWENVRDNLGENDCAVEFSSYRDNDEVNYCALLLREDYETPICIRLCTESQILAASYPYSTSSVYDLIWKPLEPHLTGVTNLYFSPMGCLHQLPVEHIAACSPVSRIANVNIYRLSNTRELVRKRPAHLIKKAVLYGGIRYEIDDSELEVAFAPHSDALGHQSAYRGLQQFDVSRIRRDMFTLDFLKGSLTEVNNIGHTLEDSNFATLLLTGAEASEASFKDLSGKDFSILHIATHGFYNDGLSEETEDQSLRNTGLMMAGAANSIYGEGMEGEFEDGILTAREVSRLDLSNTSLVVLSACNSGLGEIKSEGVFGLQRGFKKAGVGSILMSLWPVDDEATQILMTRFYHNLANNLTKNEALKEAQKYLQTVDDGFFSDAEYWAAFILLDALD